MQGPAADSKINGMTIGQLEADKSSSVWVLNTSNPKGQISVSVPDGMGNNNAVLIQVTWVPIDLTTQATKLSLLSSPVFRRFVTLRMLTIISEEAAQLALDSDEARAEMERIYNLTQEITQNATTIPAEVKSMQSEATGAISGFAMNIAHTESLEESQVMNTIKGNEGTMTKDDMKYVAENSKYPRVKAYMTEKLMAKAA